MTSGTLSHKSLSNSSLRDGKSVYCLCKSSDCSTFMIACDACNIWYHGSCIGISEKESARIENFFCHQCRHKTPSLQIKYNKSQKEIEEKLAKFIRKRLRKEAKLLNPEHQQNDTLNSDARKVRVHSSSMDQFTNDDSTSNQSDSSTSSSNNLTTRPQQIAAGSLSATDRSTDIQSVQHETLSTNDNNDQTNRNTVKRSLITKNTGGHREKRKRNSGGIATPKIKREPKSENDDDEDTKNLNSRRRRRMKQNKSRQCYGPGCVFEARPLSKYCSDKCGLELARNRLLQFLPMRLMQWQTVPSTLDMLNKKAIEDIRVEIEQIRERLAILDQRQTKLNEIIERAKDLTPTIDNTKTETVTDEPDGMCFCILCNQEVSQKSYTRHVDKCFIRFESQVSYGSTVKSNIEGLFCDNYDRTTNLYCKRLKIICPEHSRDPKVRPDEPCGCPLEKNLFELTDELCTAPKRTCTKHFKWDRKRRAQIDLERLQELMRLEELIEKENRLKTTLNERGSVAGLLLHKTIAH